MHVNQTASITHPLAISNELLTRLDGIFNELKNNAYEALAREHSIDVGEVKRIGALSPDQLEIPPYPQGCDDEEYEKYRELDRERNEQREIAFQLRSETATTYSVKYDSGLTTATNDIDQFKDIIREESGKVEFIHAEYGEYGGTRVKLRLGGSAPTATFDISGERKDVDFIFRSISDALKSATPDHPFLHRTWLQGLVVVVLSTLFVSAGLDFFGLHLVRETTPAKTASAEVLLRLLIGTPLILYLLAVMEKAFPRCQVEFGPNWRRQRALRTRVYAMLTVVLIPVLINVFV